MPNIAELPWQHADTRPLAVAVRGDGRVWTYARLQERAAAVRRRLHAAGVAPGERVLLVAPSVPEFVAAFHGIAAAGAIVVPVNVAATADEVAHVLADAGCTHALAWVEACEATDRAAAALGGVVVDRLGPELASMPAAPVVAAPHPVAGDMTAVIVYTSGTTGPPKGAELTHANLRACAEAFVEVLEVGEGDALGTPLPLFHVFGGAVVMGTALLAGVPLSLVSRFSVVPTMEMIRRDAVTVFVGVPTMYNALLRAQGEDHGLDALRVCVSGGASLPERVLRGFDERFGAVILEGYGMTETTGAATFNRLDRRRKTGSVGAPLPGVAVRVVGPTGADAPVGEVGEVLLRGTTAMKGYWGHPEATAATLRGGWIHTGDLGALDADGDLRIVDRKKDLIIHGGYNVYPREVEEVLYRHPDVVEAAVVGVPDDHYGEQVGAVVALRPDARPDAAALQAWLEERLSAYKVPRLLHFVDALPKGSTGKIAKRELDRAALTRTA